MGEEAGPWWSAAFGPVAVWRVPLVLVVRLHETVMQPGQLPFQRIECRLNLEGLGFGVEGLR